MAGSFCVRLGVGGLGVSGAVCVCDCGVVLGGTGGRTVRLGAARFGCPAGGGSVNVEYGVAEVAGGTWWRPAK